MFIQFCASVDVDLDVVCFLEVDRSLNSNDNLIDLYSVFFGVWVLEDDLVSLNWFASFVVNMDLFVMGWLLRHILNLDGINVAEDFNRLKKSGLFAIFG